MKLNIPPLFDSLWTQVRRLTDEVEDIDLEYYIREIDPIDIQLGEGLEVSLDELGETGGLFEYRGRQILLYIPDHGRKIEDVLAGVDEGKKFHLCDCKTLVQMRNRNRFDRYFATTDLSGEFKITGQSYDRITTIEGNANLYVCMNCVTKLNYKNAAVSGKVRDVRNSFNIQEFFETYSSCFTHYPSERATPNTMSAYTSDWDKVSARKRATENYICEECQVDLKSHKRLLHVHHIDGQKGNNRPENLKALCVDCHRKQPMHSSMFVKRQDMTIITKLRVTAKIIGTGWDDAMKYADPAVKGALGLLNAKAWEAPEIGYEVMGPSGEVIMEFEAAWPRRKTGLYINNIDASLAEGWKAFSLAEILDKFG